MLSYEDMMRMSYRARMSKEAREFERKMMEWESKREHDKLMNTPITIIFEKEKKEE